MIEEEKTVSEWKEHYPRVGTCKAVYDGLGYEPDAVYCQLPPGHDGPHQCAYADKECGRVVVQWERSSGVACPRCGEYVYEHEIELSATGECSGCRYNGKPYLVRQ